MSTYRYQGAKRRGRVSMSRSQGSEEKRVSRPLRSEEKRRDCVGGSEGKRRGVSFLVAEK